MFKDEWRLRRLFLTQRFSPAVKKIRVSVLLLLHTHSTVETLSRVKGIYFYTFCFILS